MHEKFNIFKKGQLILDLCGAPGGWSQVAKEYIGNDGRTIILDLQTVRLEGIDSFVCDITSETTLPMILQEIDPRTTVDMVLADCAPKVSGAWHTDQARQIFLAENALILAIKLHAEIFITKVFEGRDFNEFRANAQKSYSTVRVFKPKASRKESAETYIIISGYKGQDALLELEDNN
jgi:23S rRNA (uridine2552-2'-O)-methyltransferase